MRRVHYEQTVRGTVCDPEQDVMRRVHYDQIVRGTVCDPERDVEEGSEGVNTREAATVTAVRCRVLLRVWCSCQSPLRAIGTCAKAHLVRLVPMPNLA